MGWLDRSARPIGIDFGAHAVRVVQLRGSGSSLALQAAARVERGEWPQPLTASAVGATVRRALAGGDFRGRSCVISLSPSTVCSRSVRLPQMPEEELPQALQWEVKDRFGFEPEPGCVAFFKAGEVRRGTETRDELLVFAGASASLEPYLQAFVDLGMTVKAIDIQPCAILRSLSRLGSVPECGAVLDIGSRGSQLVLHRAGELVFYKYIEIGAGALDQAVSEKLGVTLQEAAQMRDALTSSTSDEPREEQPGELPVALLQAVQDAMRPKVEELAREIDMCLRYYVVTFRAARPETLVVVGRQAVHGRMLELLSGSLGLAATAGIPLRGVRGLTDLTRPDRSAEWAVAAGLSLYPLRQARAEAAA